MTAPRSQPRPEPLDLHRLIEITGAEAVGSVSRSVAITGVAALDWAGPSEIVVAHHPRDAGPLAASAAGACLIPPALASDAPAGAVALLTDDPRRALGRVAAALHPSATRPQPLFGPGIASGASVHPEARLEPDVSIDPGAVIGPGAEIGRGSTIGANAVVGAHVRIGRGAAVGPNASVQNAFVGDRAVLRAGASVGAGAVTAFGASLGRVILQDDVEIGANATVACGVLGDTVVGEGSRVEPLVTIGAGAVVGRFCIIFAAVPAGAALADFTAFGAAGEPGRAARADQIEAGRNGQAARDA